MEKSNEKYRSKPSQKACPVSVLSFLFCVLILVRVELVHRHTVAVQDRFHSKQDWNSIAENSGDTGEKQTRHRRDVCFPSMAEVTAEIDKKLKEFKATLCTPKEKVCAQGPTGPTGTPGKAGKTGAKGRPGRKGSQGAPGQRGAPGINGKPGRPGARGPAGIQGERGEPGNNGLSEPKVHVSPSNLTVGENQNALFHCSASGNPTPKVTWSRAEDSGNRPLKSSKGVLQIHNAGLSDIGKYTCSAKNLIGHVEDSVELFVKVPPRFQKRLAPFHKGFETLTTNMTCDITGFPDPVVTWTRAGSQLSQRHVMKGKSLVIRDTRTSDRGAYMCTGKNELGSVSDLTTLEVQPVEPPKLIATPSPTVVIKKKGEVVNVTCSASGRPTPEVTWTKDGATPYDVTVTNNSTSGDVTSELVIKDFQPRHNGNYTCMFYNQKNQTAQAFTRVGLNNCGHPGFLQNGFVIGSSYWPGDVTHFTCNRDYVLVGSVVRVCLVSGQWSGQQPRCSLVPLECHQYSVFSKKDRHQSFGRSASKCDKILTKGWYRFRGNAGTKMADTCVPTYKCNAEAPGWLSGGHPTVSEGVVTRKVCYNWSGNCCNWSNNIRVRNCGVFFVYELIHPPHCDLRYCGAD